MLASEVGEIKARRRTECLFHRISPTADLDEVIPDLGRLEPADQTRDIRLMQVEHATGYLDAHRCPSCVWARRHISTIPTTADPCQLGGALRKSSEIRALH